jgi:hypothetical protein
LRTTETRFTGVGAPPALVAVCPAAWTGAGSGRFGADGACFDSGFAACRRERRDAAWRATEAAPDVSAETSEARRERFPRGAAGVCLEASAPDEARALARRAAAADAGGVRLSGAGGCPGAALGFRAERPAVSGEGLGAGEPPD